MDCLSSLPIVVERGASQAGWLVRQGLVSLSRLQLALILDQLCIARNCEAGVGTACQVATQGVLAGSWSRLGMVTYGDSSSKRCEDDPES